MTSKAEVADFDTTVSGIPCGVIVRDCIIVKGSFSYNAASDLDYHGYTEIDFNLLDRKGYAAGWLERKMTDAERAKIEQQIIDRSEEPE
jgi:hypothetical protein